MDLGASCEHSPNHTNNKRNVDCYRLIRCALIASAQQGAAAMHSIERGSKGGRYQPELEQAQFWLMALWSSPPTDPRHGRRKPNVLLQQRTRWGPAAGQKASDSCKLNLSEQAGHTCSWVWTQAQQPPRAAGVTLPRRAVHLHAVCRGTPTSAWSIAQFGGALKPSAPAYILPTLHLTGTTTDTVCR